MFSNIIMNCLEKIKYYQLYLSLDDKYKYILSKNFKKINWEEAVYDEYAIWLMEKYFEEADWFDLSCYSSEVIPFFEKHQRFIHWGLLSRNPYSCHILENNLDKVDWKNLSFNTGAFDIIENNLDKISWYNLSGNPSAGAIKLLEKNIDKINWNYLSVNPEGLHLLENNLDKINWTVFERNPKRLVLIENMINKRKALILLDNRDARIFLKRNRYEINWDKLTILQQEKEAIKRELDL